MQSLDKSAIMLFQCRRLYPAVINNCSMPLHQAPSCLTYTWVLVLIQLPNKSQINQGLWPWAHCKAALFSRGLWGNGKSLPTTARLLQTTFTIGFSHVSYQKSWQGQDTGSESLLSCCICSTCRHHNWKLALGKPKSCQITTSNWLYNFAILAGNHRYIKSKLSSIAETGRNLERWEPTAGKWFYPFSFPSSPAFRAETSLLFPEPFIKGSEVFLWITLMFQAAILLLCKIPFSALLKLIQSGITHFVKSIVQKY